MKHTQSDLEAMRDEDENIVSVFHSDKKNHGEASETVAHFVFK